VKSLPIGECREAFLTTNKARVVAHVWITQRADNVLWLDMMAGQAAKVLQHLNHFLISEQVELADRTGEFSLFRLIGPKAVALAALSGIAPTRKHRLLALDGVDWFCPIAGAEALRQRLLDAGAVPADAATYNVLRIEAGLPEYGIDIDENRLAMEVNRTSQAISYNKGCYLGQETIVMARDRGQVNRLMMVSNLRRRTARRRRQVVSRQRGSRTSHVVGIFPAARPGRGARVFAARQLGCRHGADHRPADGWPNRRRLRAAVRRWQPTPRLALARRNPLQWVSFSER